MERLQHLLILVLIVIVNNFGMQFVRCQDSSKCSGNTVSNVTITQTPSLLPAGQDVKLTCNVNSTSLADATYFFSTTPGVTPVQCREDNVFMNTCTFRPANLIVSCEAVYNGRSDGAMCNIQIATTTVSTTTTSNRAGATDAQGGGIGGTASYRAPSSSICATTVAAILCLYN